MGILRHAIELRNLTKKLPAKKLLFDLLIVRIARKHKLTEEILEEILLTLTVKQSTTSVKIIKFSLIKI